MTQFRHDSSLPALSVDFIIEIKAINAKEPRSMMNEIAKKLARNILCEDPEIESRVKLDTERHRKGWGLIELKDKDGKPVEKAKIKLKQTKHEFHFGCNGFMYQQFKEKAANEAFDEAFKKLFNLAVVPFYWSDLEPEQGKPRFAKDSPYCYRRPSTDALVEFCEANGITPKGHPLCWHAFIPTWMPLDNKSMGALLEKRIEEIAARYKNRIKIWDVCNEAVKWNPDDINRRTPSSHVELSFQLASKYFPRTTTLTYNDYACWEDNGDYTPFYMLGRHLKDDMDVNLGALGLQFHMFGFKSLDDVKWPEDFLNPRRIFRCLDQYAKVGVPLNISEITITAHPDLGDGPAFQKEMAERLYRIWFSHPALNGIIYWNLVDDTAHATPTWNENLYKGGLLNKDLSPKPAYEALLNLVKKEWTTKTELAYEDGGFNRFNGFYGDYEAEIKTDAGTFKRKLYLAKDSINHFKMELA